MNKQQKPPRRIPAGSMVCLIGNGREQAIVIRDLGIHGRPEYFIRWLRSREEHVVPEHTIVRSAAPCALCGARADDHVPGSDHRFERGADD